MSKKWPAELAVEALLAEGVDTMFGLMGGHIQPIQDHAYRAGIDVVQVRHEQAAAYAADGYARIRRRHGVCFATAGPGMLNMVTGIHMAQVSRTPMVCLFGGHKERESHRGSMQEAYAADVCGSLTKWTVRVTEPEMCAHFIRKAFRDAMTPPYGPVGIEFPIDKFNWNPIEPSELIAYRPGSWRSGPPAAPGADPVRAAEAMDLLMNARRPLVIAGEGVYWSDAGAELKALVETLDAPFSLRRLGRGVIPEDHRLAISGGARKDALGEADVVLVIGLQLGYLESFGQWKTDARFIQLQTAADDVLQTLPTAVELVGSPKVILAQMLAHGGTPVDHADWTARTGGIQSAFVDRLARDADALAHDAPIHPRWLARIVADQAAPDMTIVFDSFTSSTFLGEQLLANRPGQILDAGLSAAFGHGVGMAIGAQMADPEGRVLAMMGDGGMGLGGGDVETAVRYGLPIVFLVYNDSTYCAGLERYAYGADFKVLGPNGKKGFRLTDDVRYDRMYETLGCHVEHVTDPSTIAGAIDRAFAARKTAVINLIGTRDVRHPLYDSANAREMFWHLPAAEVEEPARKRHHEQFYPRYHGGALLDR